VADRPVVDRPVTDREVLRLAPPVILWWVWVAFVAANVVDYAVQGLPSARFGAVVGAILLLVTGLVYTLALRPRVVVSGDGVTVVNPYRTHHVPWAAIQAVDTGEWVQVHYAAGADGDDAPDTPGTPGGPGPGSVRSSATARTLHCWALYVSSRARRKIAAGPARQRDPLAGVFGVRRSRGHPGTASGYSGYAQPSSAKLPEEARYLASLPPAKAMAVRLDSRADRERARAAGGERPPDRRVTIAWSWLPLAAVAVPALILIAVALA
jgi:hypothetical protein